MDKKTLEGEIKIIQTNIGLWQDQLRIREQQLLKLPKGRGKRNQPRRKKKK